MKKVKYGISIGFQKKELLINSLLFLLAVQFMPPQGMPELFPSLYNIIWPGFANETIYIIVTFVAILTFALKKKIDKSFIVALIFPLAAAALTILQGLDIHAWLLNYSCVMMALLMVQINKRNLIRLIRMVRLYLEILIIINLFYVIMYPNGAYRGSVFVNNNWFLGYKSSLQCYILPCFCLEWLDSHYSKKNLRFIVMIMIEVTEAILSHNAMLTVGIVILVLFMVLRLYEVKFLQNGYLYVAVAIGVNVMFIFFITILSHMSLFQAILQLFGKTSAISGRTSIIWPKTLMLITEKPLFGHGVYPAMTYVGIFGSRSMPHAHNMILQVLLDGGFALLAVFFVWLFYICHKLRKCKELRSSQVLLTCIFVVLLMGTVEVYIYGTVYFATWLVFSLGMYTRDIDWQYHNYIQSSEHHMYLI